MNSCELLFLLKKEAEEIPIENFINIETSKVDEINQVESMNYIAYNMNRYNRSVFLEIKNRRKVNTCDEINKDLLNDFKKHIEYYMEESAPGLTGLKRYILLVSTYLVFIKKRPLHPPGMIMRGREKIIAIDGKFYCPLKIEQLEDKHSLCVFCVCKDATGLSS